ncbi:MarR family winged helix-turn-helix transcriptional regulator [Nocardioides ungokensis]|uniref:MarR family winged helix-turn-helix transcriptional regulator n=1 Tax=Nocardioides ungokensis TaxID=1643322 RepID=UPI001FEAD4FD|nr:MarR family transcriptional regulator [Nocardioides ungokensis]
MTTDDDLQELSSDLVVYAARLVRAVRRANELPAGFRILSLLDEHGPLGITALAAADRSSQPTMSGTVTGLAGKGWVEKRPNPADARGSVVTLTDTGRRELNRVRRMNGELVATRIAAHHEHTAQDVATAVAVLRDVLGTGPDTEKGTL